MIGGKTMKLEDARVGMKVRYIPFKDCPKQYIEEGIITSVNDKYVFVRYLNQATSKATRATNLSYLFEGED